jgi:WD40 repeat protein
MAETPLRRLSKTEQGLKASLNFFKAAGAANYKACQQNNYISVIKRILKYFCNNDALIAGSPPEHFIHDTELPDLIVEGYDYIPVIDNKECVAVIYQVIEKDGINHILAFIRIGDKWYNADNEYGYLRLLENPNSPPSIKKLNKYLSPENSNDEYVHVGIADYYMFYIAPERITSLDLRRQRDYSGKPCFGQFDYTCGPDSIQSILMLADGFFEIFNQGIFNNTVLKILEKLPAAQRADLADGKQAPAALYARIEDAIFKSESAKKMWLIKDFISTMFLRYYHLLSHSLNPELPLKRVSPSYKRATNNLSQNYKPRFSKSEKPIIALCLVSQDGQKHIARSITEGDEEDEESRGLIELFNLTTREYVKTLEGHTAKVNGMTAMGDGLLVSASDDMTVQIWDLSRGVPVCVLKGHTAPVYSVCSMGNAQLASCSFDETVRIWDAERSVCLRVLKGHKDAVLSVCTMRGAQWLVSASSDKTVRTWDVASGECIHVLEGHTDLVFSVCDLGDWERLASASFDKTVRIWDGMRGTCLRVLNGHTDWVNSVCSLNDGRLASASDDMTVRVWDGLKGVALRVLEGHTGWVKSVIALGDGKLASASDDRTVRIWDLGSKGGGGRKSGRTLKKYRNSSKFSRKLRT